MMTKLKMHNNLKKKNSDKINNYNFARISTKPNINYIYIKLKQHLLISLSFSIFF